MSNYPNLTDGKPLKQTTKRTVSMNTRVYQFLDMSEQRYVMRTPVQRIQGDYNTLFADEYTNGTTGLQDFHDQMQGRYDNFSLTFDGQVYSNNMYWDSDTIQFSERSINTYSSSVSLKQFPSTTFPTITVSNPSLPTLGASGSGGAPGQYPNTLYHLESNAIVDLDDTARYAYSRLISPIAGGVLILKTITRQEAQNFENFFIQLAGRYGIFSLTWNEVAMTNVRFSTDDFVLDYSQGPNICSVTLPWVNVPV